MEEYQLYNIVESCMFKLKKRLVVGPKDGVKFLISDAGDYFTEESKKLKAANYVMPKAGMTAEELKAKDEADRKAKIEKERGMHLSVHLPTLSCNLGCSSFAFVPPSFLFQFMGIPIGSPRIATSVLGSNGLPRVCLGIGVSQLSAGEPCTRYASRGNLGSTWGRVGYGDTEAAGTNAQEKTDQIPTLGAAIE